MKCSLKTGGQSRFFGEYVFNFSTYEYILATISNYQRVAQCSMGFFSLEPISLGLRQGNPQGYPCC